ncbi:hypothetical protein RNZ50_00835 [Paracoccaceae bacterium Fryx2]|nr:hypothetical protein [Paracoccaceae bacterium Fryx2]
MRSILRSLLCLVLACTLAVAGAAQAASGVAMAQTGLGMTMVLCGGEGPQTVVIGQDGVPVPALPKTDCTRCPACLSAPLLDAAAPAGPQRAAPSARRLAPPCATPSPVRPLAIRQCARAPPIKV